MRRRRGRGGGDRGEGTGRRHHKQLLRWHPRRPLKVEEGGNGNAAFAIRWRVKLAKPARPPVAVLFFIAINSVKIRNCGEMTADRSLARL